MSQIKYVLGTARGWLGNVMNDDTIAPALRSSFQPTLALAQHLDVLAQRNDESVFTFQDLLNLNELLTRFENVISSELAVANAYFVNDKRPYSTIDIIENGSCLFPPALVLYVPEAEQDAKEVGKCIAFELPTAAAFHIHRAIEAVLRRYWLYLTGKEPKAKQRNIGVYLQGLRKLGCGDPKVLATLDQLKDLHRNPTIHPDQMLNMTEAIALVGIAHSVIAAMLSEMAGGEEGPKIPGLVS